MCLIPCTADCMYQKDGSCYLDHAVEAGDQNDSELCAYYVRRDAEAEAKKINRSSQDG